MSNREGSMVLDKVGTFASCTRSEMDLLTFIAEEIAVERGTVIVEEGGTGREAYVISSGQASVTRREECIGTLSPGEFFGEMSLLAGAPRLATVTADTPMVLLVLAPAAFDSLLANAPSVLRKMMRERRPVHA